MLSTFARLFQLKSRIEVWPVIWAIVNGAVERGTYYLHTMQGVSGWIMFLGCSAVCFIAGPHLLDSFPKAAPKGN